MVHIVHSSVDCVSMDTSGTFVTKCIINALCFLRECWHIGLYHSAPPPYKQPAQASPPVSVTCTLPSNMTWEISKVYEIHKVDQWFQMCSPASLLTPAVPRGDLLQGRMGAKINSPDCWLQKKSLCGQQKGFLVVQGPVLFKLIAFVQSFMHIQKHEQAHVNLFVFSYTKTNQT